MRIRSIAITLTLLFNTAHAGPHEVVDRIATLIENNYFDADQARQVAASLRHTARTDLNNQDLAAALTAQLQPIDHHFRVTWSPQRAPSSGPSMSLETLDRRNAYGFHRVEILPGAIGYIDMSNFAPFAFGKPNEPARRAVDAALALISNADAVIIDLRNNGGGSPAMVGYLVSAFTAPDANIYNTFRHRDGSASERPQEAYANPRLAVPLYVLISGRSASAAESVAYTLQAAKRAVIVGATSAGAANPGGDFPAGEGFFVFISTSRTVNAVTGTSWEGVGVKPDVTSAEALQRAEVLALEAVLANQASPEEATETRWVLESLRVKVHGGRALTEYVGAYTGAKIALDGRDLTLKRGRRPPWRLVRLRDDVFFVKDEPYRRVMFERALGQVTRFELVRAGGQSTWFSKIRVTLPAG